MNILVAMNDAFVRYYCVMIASLCINNPDENIVIHLPYTKDLSAGGIDTLKSICDKYNAKLVTYDFTEGLLEGMKTLPVGMWAIEMFFRLFAQDFMDESNDRVLWLDGDIIVNGNIHDFYYQDMKNAYYVACEDKAISHGKIQEEYDNLGWKKEENYANSGVLLINLENLRKANISQATVVEYAIAHKSKLHYPDQYVLNDLYHYKTIFADGFIYNCQVSSHSYKLANKILTESKILHFPGYRPWSYVYQHHYSSAISGDIWWKYARKCGMGQGYFKWKILNTIKVKPWLIMYRLSRIVRK